MDSALDLEKRAFNRNHYRTVYYGLGLLAILIWGSAFLITAVSTLLKPTFTEELSELSHFSSIKDSRVFPWNTYPSEKLRLTFDDVRNGTFRPNYKQLQWIHSPESVTNDQGTYLVTDTEHGKTKYVVKSLLDESYHYTLYNDSSFRFRGNTYEIDDLKASPDLEKAILKTDTTKGWRYSSTALYWTLDVKSQKIEPLFDLKTKVSATLWAPTSNSIAFILNNNVYVKSLVLGVIGQVTFDGSAEIFNGKPDWVYEEEVFASDMVLWWSPKGDKLTFLKFNDTLVPEYTIPYFVQDGHDDYPEMVTIKYPKPGYTNPTVDLIVAEIGSDITTHTVHLDSEKIKDNIIVDVLWVSDDFILTKSSNRASDELEVYLVSTKDGAQAELVRSHYAEKAWFEVSHATFVPKNESLGRLNDGYIDYVEHEGYNHLAYFTPPHNPEPVFLTKGRWEVLSTHVDFLTNMVYFIGTHASSVERHFYSVNLTETKLEKVNEPRKITRGDGWYSGSFSSGSRFMLLTSQGPGVPEQTLIDLQEEQVVKIMESNGKLKTNVAKFDLPKQNITVISLGIDEETGEEIVANAMEVYPPSFDPSKKYPVLFYVYGGPGSQMVTQQFSILFSQVVAAELNAIVVTVDGRGTGYNTGALGSRFKFCVRDRLGHFEPLDQIAAAKKWALYPYVDEDRIAIWGWSYGGFLTLKTLETDESDVFSYGVAVAPVTKWRLYDSIYTERYLRTPQENPEGYATASIQRAEKFKSKTRFLVMHGSGDDNVHFQNSLRLVDDLNLASVENFDFMVFPDSDHSIRYHNGNIVVFDRILDWLRRAFSNEFHKHGVEHDEL